MKKLFTTIFLMGWLAFSLSAFAGPVNEDSLYVREHYIKKEVRIPMRDGVKLFAAIYIPKDAGKVKYPILMQRTPYDVGPYGKDAYKKSLGPDRYLMRDGYIFVYEDVRGRYMSEGKYDNMRPNREGKKQIDESSDTYDTIDWLLDFLKDKTTGKVGQWGISYPGFYTTAGAIDAHPALVASSPQAPVSDFFFDDFHHQGAYLESYWLATAVFGYQKDSLTTKRWYPWVNTGTPDGYQFYYDMGPLKNASKWYGKDNFFWQQFVDHPNYDQFWQERSILPHLKNIHHAMMEVGGWFDAEDLYGVLNTYKTIERNNPDAFNILVMGPWSHGAWAHERGAQTVGNIYFGDSIATFFQKKMEYKYFHSLLKEGKKPDLPEAYLFDTGSKEWKQFDAWPAKNTPTYKLYFAKGGPLEYNDLSINQATDPKAQFTYTSDPAHPVPYTQDIKVVFTPRKFMTDDQRFAARRPDVLTFETEPLKEDMTLEGEIMAHLKVATTGSAADWVVKIIDVYPPDAKDTPYLQDHLHMGNYQMLVRSEVFRGRFRNSYEKPEAFTPNQKTDVDFPLQDILHTFKKGHRIMVQIHSTWFPYIDRNPQKYVDNIFKADASDFQKADMTVYGDSYIEIGKLNWKPAAVQLESKH